MTGAGYDLIKTTTGENSSSLSLKEAVEEEVGGKTHKVEGGECSYISGDSR